MIIRPERPEDIDDIYRLNVLAFGQSVEAELVDKLRDSYVDLVSLVALIGEKIVGHILFSPAVIEGQGYRLNGMGLGPIAVLPDMQKQGIGTQLVKAGIMELRQSKPAFIIVLGHHDYYPRFGFERASLYKVRSEWEGIPDEAFMILWLDRLSIPRSGGLAKYREEFNEAV